MVLRFFWISWPKRHIGHTSEQYVPKCFANDLFFLAPLLSFHEMISFIELEALHNKQLCKHKTRPIEAEKKLQWYRLWKFTEQNRLFGNGCVQQKREWGKCVLSESTNHDPDQWNVITQQIAPGPFSRANEEELIRVLLVRKGNVFDDYVMYTVYMYI